METIVKEAGKAPVSLNRPSVPGPTTGVSRSVKLPDTIRQDAGKGPEVLERTVGAVVKRGVNP